MNVSALLQVVEEYNRRDQEIKQLEKELEEKTNALEAYRKNISEVPILNAEMLQDFLYDVRVFVCGRLRNVGSTL